MRYEAKAFVFRDKCGVGPTGEDTDTGVVVQDSPPESIVLEGVKHLQMKCWDEMEKSMGKQ